LSGLINISFRFRPKLFEHLPGYRRDDFLHDLSAGLTVGIVALPLAMAFAIASGLPPQSGIVTAIVGGFLISALGGSSVQIGGPAGAFIVVVYGIVGRYGVANLMIATICAGFLLIGLGLMRCGGWIRRLPESIVVGFTNGIAVIIGLSQIKDFFGLPIQSVPAEFFEKVQAIAQKLSEWNPAAFALSVSALCIVVLWPKSYAAQQGRWGRWLSRLPGTLAALILGTLAAMIFDLEVATIGSVFGGIPQGLNRAVFAARDSDDCISWGGGVFALRKGRRFHDSRSPRPESGADGPGPCECRLAFVRRILCNWHSSADSHQYPCRRPQPRGGHDSFSGFTSNITGRCAFGCRHTPCDLSWDFDVCRLEYGRVEKFCAFWQA